MMDGQVQRHNGVTAMYIREGLGIGARQGIGGTCPGIGLASRLCKLGGVTMIDGQVHRHNGVTANDILEVLHIVTGLCIGDAVPLEAFASRLREVGVGGRTAQRGKGHIFTIRRSETVGRIGAEIVSGVL